MANKNNVFELSDDRTQDQKGDIIADAGYRMEKEGNYQHKPYPHKQPEEHIIEGELTDDDGDLMEVKIETEVLTNPPDEIEYEIEMDYKNINDDPEFSELEDLWEKCLEDSENYYH